MRIAAATFALLALLAACGDTTIIIEAGDRDAGGGAVRGMDAAASPGDGDGDGDLGGDGASPDAAQGDGDGDQRIEDAGEADASAPEASDLDEHCWGFRCCAHCFPKCGPNKVALVSADSSCYICGDAELWSRCVVEDAGR